jgi:DNA-binding NarL/FixJ family response regulator
MAASRRNATRAHERQALTRREREILRLLMEGLTNREIGRQLAIQEQTVKNAVSVLCDKLHVRNRVQLAVTAVRLLENSDKV